MPAVHNNNNNNNPEVNLMSMSTKKAQALLAEAIVALTKGNTTTATTLTADALALLTSSAARQSEAPAPKPASKPVAHVKHTAKPKRRGRANTLNVAQAQALANRVAAGGSISQAARDFGISWPTAQRYVKTTAATITAEAPSTTTVN